MKKFEENKTYNTRDGREAIVYAVLDDVIHGAVGNEVMKWTSDGRWYQSTSYNTSNDLVHNYDWKMKPTNWFIRNTGKVVCSYKAEVTDSQKFGMRYHTEKIAEREAKRMKGANLIAYWASVLEPEWEADWDNGNQLKYYISVSENNYYTGFYNLTRVCGVPYGSKETMQKICDALNNGEIKL